MVLKAKRSRQPRSIQTTKHLAKIQETLQYLTLMRNIATNKVNEALAESEGIKQEASDNSGSKKLAGDEGA